MSLPHRSVATIDAPEFINLQPLDVNPMMSKCEIKVFYVGENRNGSYIKKEVAAEMAKTLRGAPIVGYYKDSKDDFADHGHVVTIDDEGVHFQEMTRPYGFVAPNAEVWFQKFMEEDAFGNQVEREYLMTTGYIWTGQYEEARAVLEEGKPQSMELDGDTLKGDWAENSKTGMSFFIINDAIVSKLCILGDDVEPCFEGASVTKPEISASFSLDDKFKNTLFNMMKELEFALKGEHTVDIKENVPVNEFAEELDKDVEEFAQEAQDSTEDMSNSSDFAKEDDEKADNKDQPDEEDKDKKDDEDFVKQVDDSAEAHTERRELGKDTAAFLEPEPEEESEEETPGDLTQNSLHTDEEFAALEAKYNDLQVKYDELVEFKNKVEDAQKDALIEKFFMLSDEDKKDVIENKRSYSLDDIEAKLAVICYRKKVNFDLMDSEKNEEESTDTVTFDLRVDDSTPEWIRRVEAMQSKI